MKVLLIQIMRVLGRNVAFHATVLAGVTIGDGAMVTTHSLIP